MSNDTAAGAREELLDSSEGKAKEMVVTKQAAAATRADRLSDLTEAKKQERRLS